MVQIETEAGQKLVLLVPRPVGAILPCLDIAGPDRLVAAMGGISQLQPLFRERLGRCARRVQIDARFDLGEELAPRL